VKKHISPVVIIVVVVALAAGGFFIYSRSGGGAPQYGAKMPDVVAKEFREKGPRPMPPMPMPGGGTVAPRGGAVGLPTGK
jgi:hypothetical protein